MWRVKRKSNEIMLATEERMLYVRSVRRLPVEKRWSGDCVSWVKWAPWCRYKDAEDADGEIPEGVPAEERPKERTGDNRVVFIETQEKAPRYFISGRKTRRNMGTREDVGVVPVGLEVWEDSRIMQNVEGDL